MAKRTLTHAEKSLSTFKAYSQLFDSPLGKQVLQDLFKNHAMLHSTFNGDIHQMLLKEGERNVILRILTILKMDVAQLEERIRNYEE